MTVDEAVRLIGAQWEKGLIIPDACDASVLRDALRDAQEQGLCEPKQFWFGEELTCWMLTREGQAHLNDLTNTTVQIIAVGGP